MERLSERSCTTCRADSPTLTIETANDLLSQLDGWILNGEAKTIEKTVRLRNFEEARVFFNAIADIAEQTDHHPDMGIYKWRFVKLSLTTHAAKGLTENDFIMAAKIDDEMRKNWSGEKK